MFVTCLSDAGVHALGQKCQFDAVTELPCEGFVCDLVLSTILFAMSSNGVRVNPSISIQIERIEICATLNSALPADVRLYRYPINDWRRKFILE